MTPSSSPQGPETPDRAPGDPQAPSESSGQAPTPAVLGADDALPVKEFEEFEEGSTHGEGFSDADIDEHNLMARLGEQDQFEPEQGVGMDRSTILADGFQSLARWGLRISIVILTVYLLGRALAPFWVIILPSVLGLIIATVLWPPAAWLRRHGCGPALAAAISVLGALGIFGGVITAIVPSVADQTPQLVSRSTEGVSRVQEWLQGPPFKIPAQQITNAVHTINEKITASGDAIASGVFSGVTTVGSALVALVLSLILSFFFVKDGDRFLPWMRLVAGERAGAHLTEVLTRAWHTLSGFIRTQAIVSAIDSACIGVGLVVLGVPLALPLCVITFFGGFIPILGATVAGALAVLVALVTKSVTTAVIVLVIIILVQQVEGHILQPLLQSRSMSLHPVLVLLGIAAGSEEHGVIGGFLAVPIVATVAVLFRYVGEQIDLRSGTITVDELEYRTDRGRVAALRTERLRRLAERRSVATESDVDRASREAISEDDGTNDALARSVPEEPASPLSWLVSRLRR